MHIRGKRWALAFTFSGKKHFMWNWRAEVLPGVRFYRCHPLTLLIYDK